MEELNNHLQQLPNFLQAELAAHIGSLSGLEYIGITERYIHTAFHLIIGSCVKLEIHHKHWISNGGAVYDLDNLTIMTPKDHIQTHRKTRT